MAQAKTKKKSANQLYAERYLANLTTHWHEGYHNFVFQIKLNDNLMFSDCDEEVAWTEAAEHARKLLADVRERRHEVKVIKMLRAFLPSCNAYLKTADKKAVARVVERLERDIAVVKSPLK